MDQPTQVRPIQITPLDNEVTLLYKNAEILRLPTKYVVVVLEDVLEPAAPEETPEEYLGRLKFETITTAISREIDAGRNLLEIRQKFPSVSALDVVMFYYLISSSRDIDNDVIIANVNNFFEAVGARNIGTIENLTSIFQAWQSDMVRLFNKDMMTLRRIQEIQEQLIQKEPFATTPIKYENVVVSASPRLRTGGEDQPIPIPRNGIDIYNASIPSYIVPYVQYNSEDRKYYKLYKGETEDTKPDYSVVVLPGTQTNKKNTIYMTVWSGQGDPTKATQESYMKLVYRLEDNFLTVRSPITPDQDESLVLARIQQTLPISISDSSEMRVGGEFIIFGVWYDELTLIHSILNNLALSAYLYIDESSKSYAEKKRMVVHYSSVIEGLEEEAPTGEGYITNPSSVAVSLSQHTAGKDDVFDIVRGDNTQRGSLPEGFPYIRVNVMRAASRSIATQFLKIFPRLLQIYSDERPDIAKLYETYVPKTRELIRGKKVPTPTSPTRKKPTGKLSKHLQMKAIAPDLIVNNYPRECQEPRQPIIITEEDIRAWQAKTFQSEGAVHQRQVMKFPKDSAEPWLFVCPGDESPFPGVKANTKLSNKDKYPFIPCCYTRDQTVTGKLSGYNQYYRGQTKKETKTTRQSHQISTDRVLEPGSTGKLPMTVKDLLNTYSKEAADIVRYGVIRSPNSLIHCVLDSLGTRTQYGTMTDSAQKEALVVQYRQHMATNVYPALLKQEMYGYSDNEIKKQLFDVDRFFDPALYYRAIEETFKINLFVFIPPGETEEEGFGSLEIPRHKLFHSRPKHSDRMAIVVFKHSGSESTDLDYPQCELVVDYDQGNDTYIKIFDQEMSDLLYDAMIDVSKTTSWTIDPETNNPIARANLYSIFDYRKLIGTEPTGQIIDTYGKLRGFIFPASPAVETAGLTAQMESNITIMFPPSQPENIPQINQEPPRPNLDTILTVFQGNTGTAITQSHRGVDGIWMQLLDMEHGVYCPFTPINDLTEITAKLGDLPIGPPNPIFTGGKNVIGRVKNIRRTLDIIFQLIIWVYTLSDLDAINFINTYYGQGNYGDVDSADIYDITEIRRNLPRVNTVDQAIVYLERVVPTLVRQGRFVLYSKKFAEGLTYFIQEYERTTKGLPKDIPDEIRGLFDEETDFVQQDNVAIFIKESDMKAWLFSVSSAEFRNIIIKPQLNIEYGLYSEPYLYISPEGNVYIIQNVANGNMMRAMNVALNWYVNRINQGYHTPVYENLDDPNQLPVYAIYGISTAAAPVAIEDHTHDNVNFLQILTYGPNQYAAMLPIL